MQTQIRTSTTGKLVLLSGLNLQENQNKMSTALLTEWLTGLTGNTSDQEDHASVVQVVIAGNSIYLFIYFFFLINLYF